MTKSREDARLILILSAALFAIAAFLLDGSMPWSMVDYKQHYYGARCFLNHGDPYNGMDLAKVYGEATPSWRMSQSTVADAIATIFIYPPSDCLLFAPLALLPFQASQILWLSLTIAAMIFAGVLIWDVASRHAPLMAAGLVGLLLINSEMVPVLGNSAGLSISLCVISAWCFLVGNRHLTGTICLALSLLLKPQDGVALLLFLILTSNEYRKKALAASLLAGALGLPAVVWITAIAPHWLMEWSANMRVFSASGGINDPSPLSILWPNPMINLQTITSLIDPHPLSYNFMTYAVSFPIFVLCVVNFKKAKSSLSGQWRGLAVLTALTLLAVYHRRNDSKLLLLAIPICAELWSQRNWRGRVAAVVTAAALFLTGDNFWLISNTLVRHIAASGTPLLHHLQVVLVVIPAPLSLLALALFHLPNGGKQPVLCNVVSQQEA